MAIYNITLDDSLTVTEAVALGGDVHLVLADSLVAYDYTQRSATFERFDDDACTPVDQVGLGTQLTFTVVVQDVIAVEDSLESTQQVPVFVQPTPEEQGKTITIGSPGYASAGYDPRFPQHETLFYGPGYISIY